MFIAASLATARLWKPPKCPSLAEWHIYTIEYSSEWHIHIMEYYLTIKNEILPFATASMDVEGIMLSEISQSEKDQYHMISLICGI